MGGGGGGEGGGKGERGGEFHTKVTGVLVRKFLKEPFRGTRISFCGHM